MSEQTPTPERLIAQLPAALLGWYDRGARVLPWRSEPTPYRVWVSEIMLQQTRVETVLPYFNRFVAALPDPRALAGAGEARLLKLWEGLGYYSRARNLQRAATLVVERHGGALPADYGALRALPGIGDYTAGAIASIAFGLRHSAVDGNALRVFSRLLCCGGDIALPQTKRALTAVVDQVLPQARAGDFNQALMELGATVCLPRGRARCEICPAAELCLARARGEQERLPVKSPKKARRVEQRTVFRLLDQEGRMALRRRPAKGLLAGLYEPPHVEGWLKREAAEGLAEEWGLSGALQPMPDATHIFTHVEWHMKGWALTVTEPEKRGLPKELLFVTALQFWREYAVPAAFDAYCRPAAEQLQLAPDME